MARRLLQLGFGVVFGAVLLRYLVGWFKYPSGLTSPLADEDLLSHVPLDKDLADFIQRFESPPGQYTVKVTNHIYKAVGYSFGETIILEGDEALIIIDTSLSNEAGALILQEIRKLTSKPIAAFVYTHFHNDHIQGTEGFIEDKANPPEIWAHHKLPKLVTDGLSIRPKTMRGAIHQFGIALGKGRSWPAATLTASRPMFPTRLVYDEEQQATIAGIELTFLHVPGESEDHLAVWFPAAKALISGDSVLEWFPNIYAIRGTPARDSLEWCRSVKRLRQLQAQYLIPSHGDVVTGQQTIDDLLAAYSSGIQYVHDQTVRLMNQQLHPEEIARLVQLPPSLAANPYLRPHYGRVDWTSKAIYQRYVGWFSGDVVDLQPLTPTERSRRMMKMIGTDRLLTEAEATLHSGDNQWALELATQVIRVQSDDQRAQRIRLEALRALAAATSSPTARNFYMTMILDDRKLIDWTRLTDVTPVVEMMDVESLLEAMKVRLKAESTSGVNTTVDVHFEDSDRSFRLQVLYSVLTVARVNRTSTSEFDAELSITTTEATWKKIFSKKLTMATAHSHGDVKLGGSLTDFRRFWSSFD